MSVRVDGTVEIPRREWYHLIDYMTRIDEQLEVLIKQVGLANRQLERIVQLLSTVAGALPPPIPAPPVPTPPPAPVPTVPIPTRIVALPHRVKLINTTAITVTSERATEVPLGYDLVVLTSDSDIYIGERVDSQNFLLAADTYLAVYRSVDFDKLYIKSAVGTANVYLAYFTVVA